MSSDDEYPFGRPEAFDINEPSAGDKGEIERTIAGLTIDEAEKLYPGERIREFIKDGKELSTEEDLRPDRANVETKDGKIIGIVYWG